MCGAGRFLFTVNIVHICQELCQTHSQPHHTSFSASVFWTNIWFGTKWQNDKKSLQTTNFCQPGSWQWEGSSSGTGGKGRELIIEVTNKACSALRSVMRRLIRAMLKYFISGMLFFIFSHCVQILFFYPANHLNPIRLLWCSHSLITRLDCSIIESDRVPTLPR